MLLGCPFAFPALEIAGQYGGKMTALKWSMSHAVFVPEIDDDHKEICQALGRFEQTFTSGASEADIHQAVQHLVTCIVDHFTHEERLMRAARYGFISWHKRRHDTARKRVEQFVERIQAGDSKAAPELVTYLNTWLRQHTRLPDRMLGAHLRNHQRAMFKVTLRGGTKPMDSCTWLDAHGNKFDPGQ
jgi:hemerythrin